MSKTVSITALKARRTLSALKKFLKAPTDRTYARLSRSNEGLSFIYETKHEAFSDAHLVAEKYQKELLDANNAYYEIRSIVDTFNQEHGISALQNQLAKTKAEALILKHLSSKFKQPQFSATNNKFASGVSEDYSKDIEKRLQKANLKEQDITDKCTLINASNTLEFSEELIDFLKKNDFMN